MENGPRVSSTGTYGLRPTGASIVCSRPAGQLKALRAVFGQVLRLTRQPARRRDRDRLASLGAHVVDELLVDVGGGLALASFPRRLGVAQVREQGLGNPR